VGCASELGRKRLEGVMGTGDERESCSGTGECAGKGLANTPRRPSDQHSFATQLHMRMVAHWFVRHARSQKLSPVSTENDAARDSDQRMTQAQREVRLGLHRGWLLVAISAAFPLFLLARELRMNKAEATSLRTTDTILLTLFGVAILAMTIWIVAG
jgi:hypothetical protein